MRVDQWQTSSRVCCTLSEGSEKTETAFHVLCCVPLLYDYSIGSATWQPSGEMYDLICRLCRYTAQWDHGLPLRHVRGREASPTGVFRRRGAACFADQRRHEPPQLVILGTCWSDADGRFFQSSALKPYNEFLFISENQAYFNMLWNNAGLVLVSANPAVFCGWQLNQVLNTSRKCCKSQVYFVILRQ